MYPKRIFEKHYFPDVVLVGKRTAQGWMDLAEAMSLLRREAPEHDHNITDIGFDLGPRVKIAMPNGQTLTLNSVLIGVAEHGGSLHLRGYLCDAKNIRNALGRPAERANDDYDCEFVASVIFADDGSNQCGIAFGTSLGDDVTAALGTERADIEGWPKP